MKIIDKLSKFLGIDEDDHDYLNDEVINTEKNSTLVTVDGSRFPINMPSELEDFKLLMKFLNNHDDNPMVSIDGLVIRLYDIKYIHTGSDYYLGDSISNTDEAIESSDVIVLPISHEASKMITDKIDLPEEGGSTYDKLSDSVERSIKLNYYCDLARSQGVSDPDRLVLGMLNDNEEELRGILGLSD